MTYAEVAERLGYHLCDQRTCVPTTSGHEPGWVDRTTVHYRERRMTHEGLYRFLRVITRAQIWAQGEQWQGGPGVSIYEWNQRILGISRRLLRVRLPKHLADEDRARARLWLKDEKNDPLYEKAWRWANR